MSKGLLIAVIAAFATTWLVHPAPSRADFYKYKDASGTICITNELDKVPPQFRSRVKIVKEGGSAPAPLPPASAFTQEAQGSAKPEAQPAPVPAAQNEGWLARQMPLLKAIGVVAGLLFGALFVGKLVGSLLPNAAGTLIRLALLLGVGVFIFKSYSEQIANAFTKVKSESDIAQKAVDKRSERIQKQVDP
jgi:hypothetical protein